MRAVHADPGHRASHGASPQRGIVLILCVIAALIVGLLCPGGAEAATKPTITTKTVPKPVVGVAYSTELAVSGGLAPRTWSISAGVLPAGLSIGASTGVVSGTPTAAGSKRVTVRVSDSSTPALVATKALTFDVVALQITTTTVPTAVLGAPYRTTLAAIGGTPPYSWTGKLPAGLTLSASGVVSGTPTKLGSKSVSVKATDSSPRKPSAKASIAFTVVGFAITTRSLPVGNTGQPYSTSLVAIGGTAPYTWTVSGGALPQGLRLSSGGAIAGTPTLVGTSSVTVTVVDSTSSKPNTASVTLTITVNPPDVIAISAGNYDSCALLLGGTVECWGDNSEGELGDGTTTTSYEPVRVAGLTGVTAISVGGGGGCALLSGGTVDCWGYNGYGELGDGTTTTSDVPVPVSGLTGVTAISADYYNACALLSDSTVECWGINAYDQLGDGTTTDSAVPVPVRGLTGASAISAGGYHACALLSGGTAQCWGVNTDGELGNGTAQLGSGPVPVLGLTGISAISAGYAHTCALLSGGTADCWGYNYDGELGNGSPSQASVPQPVPVSGLTGITSISAGYLSTCATVSGGGADCWGDNAYGELGNGTTAGSRVPTPVSGLTSVAAISAGYIHACAALTPGTADCWGWNADGALGTGTNADSPVPEPVFGL